MRQDPENGSLLESELLATRQEWTPTSIEGDVPMSPRRIGVERTEELQVSVTLSGPSPTPTPRRSDSTPGDMVQRQDLRIMALEGAAVTVEAFFDAGWTITGIEPSEFVVRGSAHAVQVELASLAPEFGTEWIVGMPPQQMWIWPDTTQRVHDAGYRRSRGEWTVERSIAGTSESHSSDHARLLLTLDSGNLELLVGHTSSKNSATGDGFIEYQSALPDRELRDRIRGALGFAMGKPFHCLGWTTYTSEGVVCSARSESAYSPGGAGQLRYAALPPTPLGDERRLNCLRGDKLAAVVTALARHHDELDLGHFYWLWSHGGAGSLDLAAGEYGSALEHLRRRYYAVGDREHRTKLVPKPEWRRLHELLAAALNDGVAQLNPDAGAVQILRNKLSGLNQVPGTEATRRFFEDLGLAVGEVEAKALQLRNPAAHGMAPSPGEHEQWLRRLRALQTLLNRVVLAATGASASYIDYSTRGFPARQLAERLGGPNGDGVSA